MAQATRSRRAARNLETTEPAIELSVFRVAIAEIAGDSSVHDWTPSSVWESQNVGYEANQIILLSTEDVGGDSLDACRSFAARYNRFKILEKSELGGGIEFWALVVCGVPDDENGKSEGGAA